MHTLILVAGLLTGCATKSDVDDLKARVAALEEKVEKIGSSAGRAAPTAADEEAASKLYNEINKLRAENKVDEAKAKVKELLDKYGSTRAARRALQMKAELDVIGRKVDNPKVERWFVGSDDDVDFQNGTTLVVFWEAWCPHCRREVPKIEGIYEKYKGRLKVVGLTKITRSATPEKVEEFIKENNLQYPIAKEDGSASKQFNVSGIPAAAIVKDGVIVWRGHPARINDELLESLLG